MRKKKTTNVNNLHDYLDLMQSKCKIASEYTALNPDSPEYNKRIKSMLKNWINANESGQFPQTQIRSCNKRAQNTFLKYAPILNRKFNSDFPDLPIEYIALHIQAVTFLATPDIMFMREGKFNSQYITLAAALFILDALRINETLEEALLYMPCTKNEIESIDLPDDRFKDSTFSNDIIRSMIFLIQNRDGSPDRAYINEITAAKTDIPPIKHVSQSLTSDELQEKRNNILDSVKSMSYRDRMDKILSLMPECYVTRAETRFKEKVFEFYKIVFGILNNPWKDIQSNTKRLTELAKCLIKTDDAKTKSKNQITNIASIPHNCMANDKLNDIHDAVKHIYDMQHSEATLWKQLDITHDYVCTQIDRLNDIVSLIHCGAKDDFEYKNIPETKALRDMQIIDPYELIFGYLSLLDKGDDIIWMVNTTTILLGITASRLPWSIRSSQKLLDIVDDADSTNESFDIDSINDYRNENKRHENDAKAMYDRRYNDYARWNAYNVTNPDKNDMKSINFVQFVYMVNHRILPRQVEYYHDDLNDVIIKSGINKKHAPLIRLLIDTSNDGIKNRYFLPDNNQTVDKDSIIEDLQKGIVNKDETIAALKTALHDAEKTAKISQKKIEKLKADMAEEHDELIQLRQMMYDLQTAVDATQVDASEKSNITFPYISNKNVIVFGGHPSWLRTMRLLLPKVRFIEPQENPDTNAIRNADVIWMQVNAMPHCFYNKIMDIARQRKLPVKYFTHASAEKCAQELASDDLR